MKKNMEYRREIDGLRAIAVLPVVLFHAGFTLFSGGYVGVDVFFVISGYLITSIIFGEIENGSFSIANFYERRALRILPALFFVIIACIPAALIYMPLDTFKDFSQALVGIGLFSSNIVFWLGQDYFALAAEENAMLHTWSLAVEEQFYVVFPLMLLLAWRMGKRPIFYGLLSLSILSLILSEYGWRRYPEANFYLLPTRAWELGVGALCALHLYGRSQSKSPTAACLGLSFILLSVFIYDKNTPFPSVYALLPVIGTALIILYCTPSDLVGKLLSTPLLVGIGLISFSTYLWHQPLFAFARISAITHPSQLLMWTLSGASLILGYISWRFVEHPFRKKKIPFFRTQSNVFIATGVTTALLLSFGFYGHFTNGFPSRLTDEQLARSKQLQILKMTRVDLIKAGRCHFNGINGETKLSEFLSDWDCHGDHAAIYGDSHSADKAVALTSAGLSLTRIGGAGCPLLPNNSAKLLYCDMLLSKFLSETEGNGIDTIYLASRFDDKEVSPEYLKKIINFWRPKYKQVFIFTPMVEFYRFDQIYEFYGPIKALAIPPDFTSNSKFNLSLNAIEIPKNVTIINTLHFFCGNQHPEKCVPMQEGDLMLTDYGHLSKHGAFIFGQRLKNKLPSIFPVTLRKL
jgi:peptidoglycan/LPS O-acetylase OafA/YrhL